MREPLGYDTNLTIKIDSVLLAHARLAGMLNGTSVNEALVSFLEDWTRPSRTRLDHLYPGEEPTPGEQVDPVIARANARRAATIHG